MSVKQSTPHLHLSNINDMYDNPGEYTIRIAIIYFIQLSIDKSDVQFTFHLKEMHEEFSEWVVKQLSI